MRRMLVPLALAVAAPVSAQRVTATLPVTCAPSGTACSTAQPVVNPDGTAISAGGGSTIPTGTAGNPSTQVVSVQGVSGGTAQPVSAASLPLPTGAATDATLTTLSGKVPPLGTAATSAAVPVGPSVFSVVTDGSGTVTTGGTSQQVFAASGTRVYLFCQNPTTATEPLFVNLGAAASTTAGSIELAAGGTMTFNGTAVPGTSVTVTAATTGHRFVCKQG